MYYAHNDSPSSNTSTSGASNSSSAFAGSRQNTSENKSRYEGKSRGSDPTCLLHLFVLNLSLILLRPLLHTSRHLAAHELSLEKYRVKLQAHSQIVWPPTGADLHRTESCTPVNSSPSSFDIYSVDLHPAQQLPAGVENFMASQLIAFANTVAWVALEVDRPDIVGQRRK
jgi:hypothetical protein